MGRHPLGRQRTAVGRGGRGGRPQTQTSGQDFMMQALAVLEKALMVLNLGTEKVYPRQGQLLKRDKHVLCPAKYFEF